MIFQNLSYYFWVGKLVFQNFRTNLLYSSTNETRLTPIIERGGREGGRERERGGEGEEWDGRERERGMFDVSSDTDTTAELAARDCYTTTCRPYHKKDIDTLEKIQTTKMFQELRDLSNEERLK